MKTVDIEVIELRYPGWDLARRSTGHTTIAWCWSTPTRVSRAWPRWILRPLESSALSSRPPLPYPCLWVRTMRWSVKDPTDDRGAVGPRCADAHQLLRPARRGDPCHQRGIDGRALETCAAGRRQAALGDSLAPKKRDRLWPMARSIPWARRRTRCASPSTAACKRGLKAIKIVADPFWRHDLNKTTR